MAAIHETAYPRFKPYLTKHELDEIFSISENELALINKRTKPSNYVSRLGFAILLKCFQYLGQAITITTVSNKIRHYLSDQFNIPVNLNLSSYSKSTYKKHKKSHN